MKSQQNSIELVTRPDFEQDDSFKPDTSIHFKSRVLNPVKLSLHRSQYEQILDSLKNVTPTNREDQAGVQGKPQTASPQSEKTPKNSGLEQASDSDLTRIEGSFEIPSLMFELLGKSNRRDSSRSDH